MGIGGYWKSVRPGFSRRILILAVVIMAALLVLVFIRMRLDTRNPEKPEAPETSDAALTINRFHHTATQDGKTQWVLDAAKAELYTDANKARLEDIRATFFVPDRGELKMTAASGELDLDTKDMTLSGRIEALHSNFVLRTENLHYQHDSNIISSNVEIEITGSEITLVADSATFEIDTGRLVFDGNVESWVSGIAKF